MSVIDTRYAVVPARPGMAGGEAPGAVVDLRGIAKALRRRWFWIAMPALLAGGVALAATLMMQPRYDATAKVLIDPRGIQVLQNDLSPTNTTGDETGAEIESQVQVAVSGQVLGKVAERLDLASDPEFGNPTPGLAARALATVQGWLGRPPSVSKEDLQERVLRNLQTAIVARRSEKTFVLDIGAQTWDPDKSARIANAVAETFLEQTSAARADAARRSGAALNARLDELRQRLQASEAAVESYRKGNDLISANGRLVGEQQLADLNTQLTLARARSADQESRVNEVRRMMKSANPAETFSEVTASPTIAGLRAQYAEATRLEGEARLNYGPRHPSMIAASQQVEIARKRIAEEVTRLASAAQSDYDRARASEAALTRRIEALKRESAASGQSQVRLRELERQATADRTVYESFLNRAKDLQERQSVDTGNARVITPAVAPIARAGISRALIVAGGLAFGAMLGLGLALLREQFDGTIRSGSQLAAETRLPVLATIPGNKAADPAVRRLGTILAPAATSGPARIVLIASLGAAGLRTDLAQRLARNAQGEGMRALLVDGDTQGRALTRALKAERNSGLAELLAAPSQTGPDAPRFFDGLRVITAGTDRTAQRNATGRELRAALDPFLRQSGLIVVDGGTVGPNLHGFASIADDIVLVVEGGRIALRDLQDALGSFGTDTDRVRGLVLAGTVEA